MSTSSESATRAGATSLAAVLIGSGTGWARRGAVAHAMTIRTAPTKWILTSLTRHELSAVGKPILPHVIRELPPRSHAQLQEDVRQVGAHRPRGDAQRT